MPEDKPKKLWMKNGKLLVDGKGRPVLSDHCCCDDSSSSSRWCYQEWTATCVYDSSTQQQQWGDVQLAYASCGKSRAVQYPDRWMRTAASSAIYRTLKPGDVSDQSFCADCEDPLQDGPEPPDMRCDCDIAIARPAHWLPYYWCFIRTVLVDAWQSTGEGMYDYSHVGSYWVPIYNLVDWTQHEHETTGHLMTVRGFSPSHYRGCRRFVCNYGPGALDRNSRYECCGSAATEEARVAMCQASSAAWDDSNRISYTYYRCHIDNSELGKRDIDMVYPYTRDFGNRVMVPGSAASENYLGTLDGPMWYSQGDGIWYDDGALKQLKLSDTPWMTKDGIDAYLFWEDDVSGWTYEYKAATVSSAWLAVADGTYTNFGGAEWGSLAVPSTTPVAGVTMHWMRLCAGASCNIEHAPCYGVQPTEDGDIEGSPLWQHWAYATTEFDLTQINEQHYNSAIWGPFDIPCTAGYNSFDVVLHKCPDKWFLWEEFGMYTCEPDPPPKIPWYGVDDSSDHVGDMPGKAEIDRPDTCERFTYGDCVAKWNGALPAWHYNPVTGWGDWAHIDEETLASPDAPVLPRAYESGDGYMVRWKRLNIDHYPDWFTNNQCRDVLDPHKGVVPKMEYTEGEYYFERCDDDYSDASHMWWPHTYARVKAASPNDCRGVDWYQLQDQPQPPSIVPYGADCDDAKIVSKYTNLGPDEENDGIKVNLYPAVYSAEGCPGWTAMYVINWKWNRVNSSRYTWWEGDVLHSKWVSATSNGCSSAQWYTTPCFGYDCKVRDVLNWFGHVYDPQHCGSERKTDGPRIGMSSRTEKWSNAENDPTSFVTSTLVTGGVAMWQVPAYCCAADGTAQEFILPEDRMVEAWSGCGDYVPDVNITPSDKDDSWFIDPPVDPPDDSSNDVYFRQHKKIKLKKGTLIIAELWDRQNKNRQYNGIEYTWTPTALPDIPWWRTTMDTTIDSCTASIDVFAYGELELDESMTIDGAGDVATVRVFINNVSGVDNCYDVSWVENVTVDISDLVGNSGDPGFLTHAQIPDEQRGNKVQMKERIPAWITVKRVFVGDFGYVLDLDVLDGTYNCGFTRDRIRELHGWAYYQMQGRREYRETHDVEDPAAVNYNFRSPDWKRSYFDQETRYTDHNINYKYTYDNTGEMPPSGNRKDSNPKVYYTRRGLWAKRGCMQILRHIDSDVFNDPYNPGLRLYEGSLNLKAAANIGGMVRIVLPVDDNPQTQDPLD